MKHLTWIIALLAIASTVWSCAGETDSTTEILDFTGPSPVEAESQPTGQAITQAADNDAENIQDIIPVAADMLTGTENDSTEFYSNPLPDMPEPTVGMKVRHIGRYADIFNDSNYIHWAEAEKIGIVPLSDTRSHWDLRRPIVKVAPCRDFFVEPLTYSRPYLIPEAAALLHEIGARFRDTIASRGGGDYRIKVTSVLRTPESVSRLRRRNSNALDSSVHQLGTTFDISYSRFIADSDRIPRSADDLKGVLAEVLYALREEGRCWIKYELKQPCFHITVRQNTERR